MIKDIAHIALNPLDVDNTELQRYSSFFSHVMKVIKNSLNGYIELWRKLVTQDVRQGG